MLNKKIDMPKLPLSSGHHYPPFPGVWCMVLLQEVQTSTLLEAKIWQSIGKNSGPTIIGPEQWGPTIVIKLEENICYSVNWKTNTQD